MASESQFEDDFDFDFDNEICSKTTETNELKQLKKELKLYKNLFNKNNLKEINLNIKEFQQPVAITTIETDEILKHILKILYCLGYQIHLKEFKKYIVNNKIYTRKTLDIKLDLLVLINFLEIKEHYIKLTAQAISYFKKEYHRPNIKILRDDKLKNITRAKLSILDMKQLNRYFQIEKMNNNIYKYTLTRYSLVAKQNETRKSYLNKLETCIKIIKQELDLPCLNLLKQANEKDKNLIAVKVEIAIEKDIYKKYSNEINEVRNDVYLDWRSRADVQGKVKLKIQLMPMC